MSRARVAVREPSAAHDYVTFPAETSTSRVVFRAHHKGLGAWYFSAQVTPAGGRFDLPAPDGTCYLADSSDVAVRERLGPTYSQAGVVPHTVAADFVVTELRLTAGLALADLTDPKSARFGVTNELSTMDVYSVPQAWARALRGAGFAGIRYLARFTPGRGPNAWAVFGEHGPRTWRTGRVVSGLTAAIAAGFEVLGSPATSRGLRLSRPPGVAEGGGLR